MPYDHVNILITSPLQPFRLITNTTVLSHHRFNFLVSPSLQHFCLLSTQTLFQHTWFITTSISMSYHLSKIYCFITTATTIPSPLLHLTHLHSNILVSSTIQLSCLITTPTLNILVSWQLQNSFNIITPKFSPQHYSNTHISSLLQHSCLITTQTFSFKCHINMLFISPIHDITEHISPLIPNK